MQPLRTDRYIGKRFYHHHDDVVHAGVALRDHRLSIAEKREVVITQRWARACATLLSVKFWRYPDLFLWRRCRRAAGIRGCWRSVANWW